MTERLSAAGSDPETRAKLIRDFELACNSIVLYFHNDDVVREVALKARGDLREALGEERT